MYSSSFVTKHILVPILVVVAIQVLLIRSVSSFNTTNAFLKHKCHVNQGKYKPGSEYEKNLKHILRAVSVGDFLDGFQQFSRGENPDESASIILQCRGDSYGGKCRSCYNTALSQFRKKCPSYKGGLIWYDQCLIEISTKNNSGKIDYDNSFCMSNPKKVNNFDSKFFVTWLTHLLNMTILASDKKNLKLGAPALYKAGDLMYGKEKMYGMVQCTKDLSHKSCEECARFFIVHFQDCFMYKRGGRVIGRSCNLRFEFYPFLSNQARRKSLKT